MPLIKKMVFVKRKKGMSRERFERYWLNEHADFFLKVPGIKKYVINIVQPSESNECPYDGVAELWYDSLESMELIDDTSELKQFLREDNPRFQDVTKRRSVIVAEHPII